jgi:hypothetical protein
MSDIENILFEMERRGDAFFEDTFRLARVLDLLNKSRIQQEFEHTVISDVPQRIERKVNEVIDWLVESNLRQWQAVNEHLAERRREHQSRILGDNIGTFQYDRERLIESVLQSSRRVVDTFDKTREAQEIAEGAQSAVAASAAIEIGAIGLGAIITALATTAAADITGILVASLIAALGLFVIPARRRQAKTEMNAKITELREDLSSSLLSQLQREIDRSAEDIQQAIGPYTRFVRAEREKLEETRNRLLEIQTGLEQIKIRIETL